MSHPSKSSSYVSKKDYQKAHNRLRRKLTKIAFDNHYHCNRCGAHNNLEIHFLNYQNIDNIDNIDYEILCKKCHRAITENS